jgi:hypothetical protein
MKPVKIHEAKRRPRKAGALKDKLVLAPDFDEIPEGFEEYLG